MVVFLNCKWRNEFLFDLSAGKYRLTRNAPTSYVELGHIITLIITWSINSKSPGSIAYNVYKHRSTISCALRAVYDFYGISCTSAQKLKRNHKAASEMEKRTELPGLLLSTLKYASEGELGRTRRYLGLAQTSFPCQQLLLRKHTPHIQDVSTYYQLVKIRNGEVMFSAKICFWDAVSQPFSKEDSERSRPLNTWYVSKHYFVLGVWWKPGCCCSKMLVLKNDTDQLLLTATFGAIRYTIFSFGIMPLLVRRERWSQRDTLKMRIQRQGCLVGPFARIKIAQMLALAHLNFVIVEQR